MLRNYWYVLVPVHVATSIVWYGSFYVMCKSGLDVVGMMEAIGIGEKILNPLRSSDVGYYALAYAMYKIATPARYTVTVGGTGYTVKILQQRGILTAKEVKEQIKDTADDLKDDVKERIEDTKDNVKERLEDVKDKIDDRREQLKEKYEDFREGFEDVKDRLEDRRDKVKDSVHKFKKKGDEFKKKLTIQYKDKR